MGEAIYKIITIAELVRLRVKGLHQVNDIFCREFIDEYEPLEEGLDHLKFKRKVACFQIILFKDEQKVDKHFYGYQEMLPDKEVNPDLELPGPQNKKYFTQKTMPLICNSFD